VQFDCIGLQPQRPFEERDRPLRPAKILADIAEIVEGIHGVRREGDRMLEACQGLGGPTLFSENIAEVVVKRRISAVPRNRHAKALDRIVGAPALMLYQSEQMEGLGMTGIQGQDLMANPFRLGQPARALIGERAAEPSGDRRPRVARRTHLLCWPGLGPALLSIHHGLIAQLDDAYPPWRNTSLPRRVLWSGLRTGISRIARSRWRES